MASKKAGLFENLEFYEEPYDQNEKFSVYIPKKEDKIMQLISREKARTPGPRYGDQQLPFADGQSQRTNSHQSFREKLLDQVEQARIKTPQDGVTHQSQQQQQYTQNDQGLDKPASAQQFQTLQNNSQLQGTQLSATKPLTPLILSQKRQSQQTLSRYSSQNCQKSASKSNAFSHYSSMHKSMQKLREKLYYDEKTKTVPKTTLKNKIIEEIVEDSDVFLKNQTLMSSVIKLKSLHLLKQHDIHVNSFPGVGKFEFVLNDFHNKSTNPGYSRNKEGGYFYTR